MKKKKSNLPKWKYDFSCKKCRHIQYVKDKVKRRDGDYCIKFIERTDAGLPSPIHADDDRVVRCDPGNDPSLGLPVQNSRLRLGEAKPEIAFLVLGPGELDTRKRGNLSSGHKRQTEARVSVSP